MSEDRANTLPKVRQAIALQRLELLMQQRAALDAADFCRRELAAIERRLEMIESVEAK